MRQSVFRLEWFELPDRTNPHRRKFLWSKNFQCFSGPATSPLNCLPIGWIWTDSFPLDHQMVWVHHWEILWADSKWTKTSVPFSSPIWSLIRIFLPRVPISFQLFNVCVLCWQIDLWQVGSALLIGSARKKIGIFVCTTWIMGKQWVLFNSREKWR